MQLQTKALYNLIHFNLKQGNDLDCEPWQKQDLESLSENELFSEIHKLGFDISEEQFSAFGQDADSPEALTEFFIEESGDHKLYDRLYLMIFELWKRYFPDRKSISIYCDELDQLIYLYDNHLLESDEEIQDALESLKEILEENLDEGQDPQKVWALVSQYCAHDLSSFMFDYISELIDTGHEVYASELIDAFEKYIQNRGIEFLKIRTLDFIDAEEKIGDFVSSLLKDPDYSLQIEVLDFLTNTQNAERFKTLLKRTIEQTEDEDSFFELIDIAIEYYQNFNNEEKTSALEELESKGFSEESNQAFKKLIT